MVTEYTTVARRRLVKKGVIHQKDHQYLRTDMQAAHRFVEPIGKPMNVHQADARMCAAPIPNETLIAGHSIRNGRHDGWLAKQNVIPCAGFAPLGAIDGVIYLRCITRLVDWTGIGRCYTRLIWGSAGRSIRRSADVCALEYW